MARRRASAGGAAARLGLTDRQFAELLLLSNVCMLATHRGPTVRSLLGRGLLREASMPRGAPAGEGVGAAISPMGLRLLADLVETGELDVALRDMSERVALRECPVAGHA